MLAILSRNSRSRGGIVDGAEDCVLLLSSNHREGSGVIKLASLLSRSVSSMHRAYH